MTKNKERHMKNLTFIVALFLIVMLFSFCKTKVSNDKVVKLSNSYIKLDGTRFKPINKDIKIVSYKGKESYYYTYTRNYDKGMYIYSSPKRSNKNFVVTSDNDLNNPINMNLTRPTMEIGSRKEFIFFNGGYRYNKKTKKIVKFKIPDFHIVSITPLNDSTCLAFGSLKTSDDKLNLCVLKIDIHKNKIVDKVYVIDDSKKSHPRYMHSGRFYVYNQGIVLTVDKKSISLLFSKKGDLIQKINLLPVYDFGKLRKYDFEKRATDKYIKFSFIKDGLIYYVINMTSKNKKGIIKQYIDKYDINTGNYVSSSELETGGKRFVNFFYRKDTLHCYYNQSKTWKDDVEIYKRSFVEGSYKK